MNKDADRELNPFNREAKQSHLTYIDRRWEMLAAIAWKEYAASGREALLFTQTAESGQEWDCLYLPLEVFAIGPEDLERPVL